MNPVTVWKFPLPRPTSTGRSFIDMPVATRILSVGIQDDALVVWALVDPSPEKQPGSPRRFIVANTGVEIPGFPEGARFLGTVTSSTGVVWHVWDGDAETTS